MGLLCLASFFAGCTHQADPERGGQGLPHLLDRQGPRSAATHPDTVPGVRRRESGVPQFEVTILKEFKEEVMSSDMTMEEVLGMSNTELMGR